MPAPCTRKARKPEPAPQLPLPRWCQPPPPERPRYFLDDLPTTGNDLPYYERQRAQGGRHAV